MSKHCREHLALLTQLENLIITKNLTAVEISNPLASCCWEIMRCKKKRCPAYGTIGRRCWHVYGTLCSLKTINAALSAKWRVCRRCKVFISATPTCDARVKEALSNIYFSISGMPAAKPDMTISSTIAKAARLYKLTSREAQILPYLLHRYSRHQTAAELSISPETVKVHTRHIYTKTGVRSNDALRLKLKRDSSSMKANPLQRKTTL